MDMRKKMADNKITIGTTVDDSEFNRKISEMQQKIKSLRETGPGGTYSQLSQQYRAQGDEQRAQQIENYRKSQERASKQDIQRDLRNQNRELKEIEQRQRNIQGIIDRGNITQEKAAKAAENLKRIKQEHLQISKQIVDTETQLAQINQANRPQGFERLGTALMKGGPSGMMRAMQRMGPAQVLNLAGTALSGVAAAGGAIGGAMSTYGNFRYMQAQLPARQAGRELGIAEGTTQLRGRAIRGENFEDIAYAPERARAIDQTMDFFQQADEARLTRARGKAVMGGAGVIGAGVVGAKIGAKIGAGVGSIIPGAGTAVGAGVGTLLGGIGGAAMAGLGFFGSDEEAYYGLTGNKKALTQMTGREAMQNYETFKMNQRLADPNLYYQKKMLAENRGRFLGLQRSGGMTDEQMFGEGGFVQRGAGDFLLQERMGMAEQIVGAGGSGYAATQGGVGLMALQAQRSMGLTNAGQTMGRLTSYMGATESEEAFVRILSKGVSIGLDESEYREEAKDYMAQVAAIASQIGGGDEMVASALAAGIEGDISRRGVQMSADAFGRLENVLSEQGGVTGAARAGLISEEGAFQNIKGMSRLAFQNLKMSDIREDSDVMKMYYEQAGGEEGTGLSFEDFVNKRQDVQRKALFQAYKGTEIGDTLQKFYKEGQQRELSPEEIAKSQEMLKMLPGFENMTSEQLKVTTKQYLGTERVEEATKAARKRALETQQKIQEGGFGPLRFEEGDQKFLIEERLKGKGVGIDRMEKQQAEQQAVTMEGMGENMKNLFNNVEKFGTQTSRAMLVMESFNTAMKDGPEAVDAFIKALDAFSKRQKKGGSGNPTTGKKLGNKL
jgi:hypothetical protein